MGLELSRSAGAYSHPPDRQAEALRDIARQQATANTWNMIQTGVMAGQLAVQSAIHGQMEQVKRQTADTLAIQQELLNREQLQQNLEEFIFQTEKLVAEFSAKSEVPASTRYFLLQSVLVQVEEDGIDTAMIRGRDNKAAFERAMASVNRLVAELLKDPEVQQAIKWAEKEAAKRAEKRQKIENELSRLYEQRASIESQLDPVTFSEAARRWYGSEMEKLPQQLRTPAAILFIVIAPMAVLMVVPAIVLGTVALNGISQFRAKANAETNEPINYQLQVVNKRIAALESELS
mgnify:FL=1|jgi:hypothetical protein